MTEAYDLVVIGGGPAGYTAALRVADLGGRAALIEEQAAGGNCVHFNCIPTTIMLDTLDVAARAAALSIAGILNCEGLPAFNRAVNRKQHLVAAMAAGIRSQLKTKKVDYLQARAFLERPGSVRASLADGSTQFVTGRAVLVATGARPEIPEVTGIDSGQILSADALLRLTVVPRSVLLLGGGRAGLVFVLEMAQVLAGFGCTVTVVEPGDTILPGEERQLIAILVETLKAMGVQIVARTQITAVRNHNGVQTAVLQTPDGEQTVPADCVAVPDCRQPYWSNMGLEALRPEQEDGALVADEHGETSVPGLFAAGDVVGSPMYSHVAAQAGRVVGEYIMGGRTVFERRFLPRAISTDPELAAVGLTEQQAKEQGRAVRTGIVNFLTNARAITMGQRDGVVKVVADSNTGEILGVHILGPGAGELIGQAALAMRLEATVDDLAATIHWHPSLCEALTEAARRAAGV